MHGSDVSNSNRWGRACAQIKSNRRIERKSFAVMLLIDDIRFKRARALVSPRVCVWRVGFNSETVFSIRSRDGASEWEKRITVFQRISPARKANPVVGIRLRLLTKRVAVRCTEKRIFVDSKRHPASVREELFVTRTVFIIRSLWVFFFLPPNGDEIKRHLFTRPRTPADHLLARPKSNTASPHPLIYEAVPPRFAPLRTAPDTTGPFYSAWRRRSSCRTTRVNNNNASNIILTLRKQTGALFSLSLSRSHSIGWWYAGGK